MTRNIFTQRLAVYSRFLAAFLLLVLSAQPETSAQAISACDANPFCSDSSYVFENETDIGVTIGDDVAMGCLGSAPCPVWYYMEIGIAGTIELLLEQFDEDGDGIDVDFAMYGPYESLEAGCIEVEDGDEPIQCSYSGSYTETLGLGVEGGTGTGLSTPPSAEVGEVYLVLITNFSTASGTIHFSQTGGTGAATCSIVCGLTASNSGDVCEGQPVTLLAQNSDTTLTFEYTWVGPEGVVGTGTSITIVPPAGLNEYTLYSVETSEGDTCTATTSVNVHPLPDVTLTDPEDKLLCNTESYTISLAEPSAYATYQWYKDEVPVEGATGTDIDVFESGAYRVVGTTEFGCSLTSSIVNVTFSNTLVDFTFDIDKGCAADTIIFTNLSEPGSFYWHYDDGTTPPDDTTANPVHIYTEQGEYTVRLIVHDADGCVDSLRKIVDTRHPLSAAFTQSADSVCQQGENSITFSDASIGNIVSWDWNFGDGSTSAASNPTHNFTLAGTHTVRLIVTDDVPCSDTAYTTVYIDSVPYLEMTADKHEICQGDRINMSLDYLGSARRLIWDFGDGTGLNDGDAVTYHSYDQPGTYYILVTAQYPVCEDISVRDTIIVKPYPVVNLGPDTALCLNGAPFTLSTQNLADMPAGTKWSWSNGDTTASIKVVHPGIYIATANLNDCKTSDEIEVKKDCYTDIPNSFTPNNDGNNDYFYPRQLLSKGVTSFSMVIFNRWGQKIFETNSPDGRGWDGKLNSTDQPVGVYIYQIDVVFKDGSASNFSGNVTLLR